MKFSNISRLLEVLAASGSACNTDPLFKKSLMKKNISRKGGVVMGKLLKRNPRNQWSSPIELQITLNSLRHHSRALVGLGGWVMGWSGR